MMAIIPNQYFKIMWYCWKFMTLWSCTHRRHQYNSNWSMIFYPCKWMSVACIWLANIYAAVDNSKAPAWTSLTPIHILFDGICIFDDKNISRMVNVLRNDWLHYRVVKIENMLSLGPGPQFNIKLMTAMLDMAYEVLQNPRALLTFKTKSCIVDCFSTGSVNSLAPGRFQFNFR